MQKSQFHVFKIFLDGRVPQEGQGITNLLLRAREQPRHGGRVCTSLHAEAGMAPRERQRFKEMMAESDGFKGMMAGKVVSHRHDLGVVLCRILPSPWGVPGPGSTILRAGHH